MQRKLTKSSRSTPNAVPQHVAVIMDGNGRWAHRRGLSRTQGHEEGAESVRVIVRECAKSGLEQLTLYAFSTENWRRPGTEVRFLMRLLRKFLVSERQEMMDNNIRLKAIGRIEAIPARTLAELEKSIAISRSNTGMILRLALNYGGRQEIVDAARRLAQHAVNTGKDPDAFTENDLVRCLYDEEMTDPDLLIRTGGETRLSNFLLWQLSYTELWFTKTCWPGFRAAQLKQAFQAYARRERRYGGLSRSRRTGRSPVAGRQP